MNYELKRNIWTREALPVFLPRTGLVQGRKAQPLQSLKRTVLAIILLLFTSHSLAYAEIDLASEWHLLYIKVRDRLISKDEAKAKLKELEARLKDSYSKHWDGKIDDRLCFPLRGYSFDSIGGKEGSGYRPQGYYFFDGNDHRGHPGHDIFILDKNQDGFDDRTGKPVEVISASTGIVVSINLHWEPFSPLRGGNYIWIYEPIQSRYFYYAHLNEVFVAVGQIISSGDRLGTVGRTGVNAYPSKSPTHLHFVVHHSVEGYPKPINPYVELIRACWK